MIEDTGLYPDEDIASSALMGVLLVGALAIVTFIIFLMSAMPYVEQAADNDVTLPVETPDTAPGSHLIPPDGTD